MDTANIALGILVHIVAIGVIGLASRHASRWSWIGKGLVGVGLFVCTWGLLRLIQGLVGYAYQVPSYAATPQGYVFVILFTTVIAQLVALAVLYFLFAWLYEAVGGRKEDAASTFPENPRGGDL